MKLNFDYVRDILLFVEEKADYKDAANPTYHNEIFFSKLIADERFDEYDKQELKYALEVLIKENFIECSEKPYFVKGNLMTANIIGLTLEGHELLNNIRNDSVWEVVKKKASKFGGFSLSVLSSSAKAFGSALMKDPNAVQNFLDGINNVQKMF